MRCTSLLAAAACAAIAAVPGSGHAQSPAHWQARQLKASQESEAIMRDTDKRNGLLAQFQVMRYASVGNNDPAFQVIFGQYLSWYQTFIGDYPDALQSFSIKESPLPDDAPSPLVQPGYHTVPALTYIPTLARGYKAVFLNEAHNVPLTRSLTVQLLKQLRADGFNYFAVETLNHTDKDLARRGYPVAASGFYTREPVYAEMVRTALKLGYKVLAYEADDDHTGDAREMQQAQNLARIFKKDPDARVVVNGGYAHIQEQGQFLGGKSMAEHFRRITGIDPLTVEQTMLISHDNPQMDHPVYREAIRALHPTAPVVFVDTQGKPWSLRPGYDVSVLFPDTRMHRGRPTWLTLGGLRVPYFVDGNLCQNHFPCLLEARYADEGGDAVPADRLVLDTVPLMTIGNVQVTTNASDIPAGELYLRPGRYVLTATDAEDRLITRNSISVGAAPSPGPETGMRQRTRDASSICGEAATAVPAVARLPCPDQATQR